MRAIVFVLVVGALASGCLRNKFDLCTRTPPDPNCAYLDAQTVSDAGTDAGADAGANDAGTESD